MFAAAVATAARNCGSQAVGSCLRAPARRHTKESRWKLSKRRAYSSSALSPRFADVIEDRPDDRLRFLEPRGLAREQRSDFT